MTRTRFEFLLHCVPVPSREYWFSEPKRSHFDLVHKAGLQKKMCGRALSHFEIDYKIQWSLVSHIFEGSRLA
jgi:hypothetical protein